LPGVELAWREGGDAGVGSAALDPTDLVTPGDVARGESGLRRVAVVSATEAAWTAAAVLVVVIALPSSRLPRNRRARWRHR